MVRILPDFRYEVEKQFTVKDGIRLEPDSVEITGPDIMLDTLSNVYTSNIDLGQLTRNFSDKVKLRKIPGLQFSRSRIDCNIELERFTEVQLSIPIEVLNIPDSIAIQTFPSRVKLTCNVGLSKYERMDGNLFKAVVDYSEIDDRNNLLDVSILNVPVYLLSYEYYPKSVEYLKSRK
jgi:YbbR domain-containing protein